jgi:hypothetical protein
MAKVVKTGGEYGRKFTAKDVTIGRRVTPLRSWDKRTAGTEKSGSGTKAGKK